MNVFDFSGYREILKDQSGWGGISKLAKAADCQHSHMSRVISGVVQLTMDQAFSLTECWKLPDNDTEYFLTLVECERAGKASYRDRLKYRLKKMREEHLNIQKRLERPDLAEVSNQERYYSSWLPAAVHMITAIPNFQTVDMISERLGVSRNAISKCLEELSDMGLVKFYSSSKKWKFNSNSLHLSKTSPLIGIHHSHWRQKAVFDSQMRLSDGIHYSVVQVLSYSAYQKLQEEILRMIDQFAAIAEPSKEEELACFNLDYFRV